MELDTIIVGGGPAAMTAALYLLRAGKKVYLYEKDAYGGQIARSPRLENYPSIKSISGLDFSSNLYDQIEALGAEFDFDDVQKVEKIDGGFKVTTTYGSKEAKTVILATGVKHRTLGNPREEELVGKGISYCATCDGAFFAGEEVVLIGDANTALQYAIMLAETCKKVTICTLFDKFFADPILVERMKSLPNVEYFHNLETQEFKGADSLTSVVFKNTKDGAIKEVPCKGAFICIGQVPDNDRFSNLVDLEKGFIVSDELMQTKTPGLFVAGDCRVKKVRQVITATSDGATAAVSCTNYLNTL